MSTKVIHTTPVLYFKNKPGKTHKSRGASKFDGTMVITYESKGGGGWKVTTLLQDEDNGKVGQSLDVTSSVPPPSDSGVTCGFQWESSGKTVIKGGDATNNTSNAAPQQDKKPTIKKIVVARKGLQSKGGATLQKRSLPTQPVRNPPPQPQAKSTATTSLKRALPSTTPAPPIVRRPPPQPRKILKPLTSRKNIISAKKPPAQPIKGGIIEKEEKAGGLRSVEGDEASDIIPLSSKLLNSLQPHQEEGLRFLYRAALGRTPLGPTHTGSILADDMGLGKTLQSICLIYSLFLSDRRAKFVVVAPTKLLKNWMAEFDKWIGKASQPKRILAEPTTGGAGRVKDKMKPAEIIKQFAAVKPNASEVLLISYSQYRLNPTALNGCNVRLMICDEGHKLKGDNNQTVECLRASRAESKVVVSGTPVQNDLKEFFNLVDFVNPGLLGTVKHFNQYYHGPITKANTSSSSSASRRIATERYDELLSITSNIMIRRKKGEDVDANLPPLFEYAVFVKPTEAQKKKYEELCDEALQGNPLPVIMSLRKLCIHPDLLDRPETADTDPPPSALDESLSAKFEATMSLLDSIRRTAPNDKVVLISNFKLALDLFATALTKRNLTFKRVDGSTKQSENQFQVDLFNRTHSDTCFAFLLSSKAGGTGFNLIGGNRLIMFDGDWNPASDNQAMARTHRTGQKKTCIIYRMFTAGTVEETIYQRQLQKGNLAMNALGSSGKKTGSKLSKDELKDIFTLKDSACDTNDKLGNEWGEYDVDSGVSDGKDPAIKDFSVKKKELVSFIKVGRGRDLAAAEEDGASDASGDVDDSDEEGESVGFDYDSAGESDEENEFDMEDGFIVASDDDDADDDESVNSNSTSENEFEG
ncbi:hypothetical protein TrST_g13252 [Triparma strigata]|uniref:Uncharacterized protein n=1 Tax=Triparma strigata TaxID=1606541 RepID=A0A9W7E8L1_9STRA|nr:hypothetical protein TrST_g13252 [Triparma strigata]